MGATAVGHPQPQPHQSSQRHKQRGRQRQYKPPPNNKRAAHTKARQRGTRELTSPKQQQKEAPAAARRPQHNQHRKQVAYMVDLYEEDDEEVWAKVLAAGHKDGPGQDSSSSKHRQPQAEGGHQLGAAPQPAHPATRDRRPLTDTTTTATKQRRSLQQTQDSSGGAPSRPQKAQSGQQQHATGARSRRGHHAVGRPLPHHAALPRGGGTATHLPAGAVHREGE